MDHGGLFIRKAFTAAKRNCDPDHSPEFALKFASMASDYGPYALAPEKLSAALFEKLPGDLERRW